VSIDHVALLPVYLAAGTAVLAFLTDLIAPGRHVPAAVATALGAVATGAVAILAGRGAARPTFCVPGAGCSYLGDHRGALLATVFAGLTLLVVALSVPGRRSGEYHFLLGCSMTGGVVLGYAGDLITLIIALETLTLPLYALVAMRRRSVESAEGAVTFFIVSVVSTAVALLGAALLYASTGALHFAPVAAALAHGTRSPLITAAVVLLLAGLAFKVAAVPFHAWAPVAYDGAPVPIAGYLSTASKLGGLIAILYVSLYPLAPARDLVGPTLAVLAVLTMTVGNLGALRQHRMVRLLAWSSIAQAGYILAPLGARSRFSEAVAASLGYTVFYVLLEIAAFGAVIALRGVDDGGRLVDYAGSARRSPWASGALVLALIGLAGLPPGLAGLFAKVVIVRSLLGGGSAWLAVVVALNAVIGLAYYLRAAAALFAPVGSTGPVGPRRASWPVAVALGAATVAAVVVGFAPQFVLDAVGR
jgi:NADH-quinone oxidoreductase subunit N